MPAEQLEHFTLECADLRRTRDFYVELLGLEEGFRPQMSFPGYWLYCGGVPVVHLMKREAEDRPKVHTGRLDHIAFKCANPDVTLGLLRRADVPYEENKVWEVGLLQVFVHDPDGLQVELNFHGALPIDKTRMPSAA
ncbi:MAG TPA: VOC family protein [Rhizomicrobium sp.]|jgi:catechol 2,3-dioxygenase-like lactoylglutathione lyase family enzyme